MAADPVGQGPLYRGSLYSEKHGRARKWPLWAGDLYIEVTAKAGLTVLSCVSLFYQNSSMSMSSNILLKKSILPIKNVNSPFSAGSHVWYSNPFTLFGHTFELGDFIFHKQMENKGRTTTTEIEVNWSNIKIMVE